MKVKFLKNAAALMCSVAIIMMTLPANAGWDGYTADTNNAVKVVGMGNFSKIINAGATPSTKIKKSSGYSALWRAFPVKTLNFKGVLRDWTDYSVLEFWCYSEKADNAKVGVIVDCTKETSSGDSYFMANLDINWSGWKKVSLPLSSFTCSREAKLSKVEGIRFRSDGWSSFGAYETTMLYIDDIQLRSDGEGLGGASQIIFEYDDMDKYKEVREKATVIYAESENVMVGDKKTLLETVPVYHSGAVLCAEEFFKDVLKLSITQKDEKTVIKNNKHTIMLEVGKKELSLDNENRELITVPTQIDGKLMLPVAEICTYMGFEVVADGKLIIIGNDINEFALSENLRRIAAYITTLRDIDIKSLTSEDYKLLKRKWKEKIIGDANTNYADPDLKEKLLSVEKEAKNYQASMNKTDPEKPLWGKAMSSSSDLSVIYTNIRIMAAGYATPGTATYKDKQLLSDIEYALRWGYENIYGEAEIANKGWRDTTLHNWYDWQIETPDQLITTLILLEEELDRQLIGNYVKVIAHFVPKVKDYGTNRLDFAREIIGYSALIEDGAKIIEAIYEADNTLAYVSGERAAGFHEDGSYIFHTQHFHNASYGLGQLLGQTELISILDGTVFEVTNPEKDHMLEWAFNSFAPLVYDGTAMSMACGRGPESSVSFGYNILISFLELAEVAEGEDEVRIKTIIKRMVQDMGKETAIRSVDLHQVALLKEILTDDAIDAASPYILSKVFNEGDKAVHHSNNFTTALAMSSSRVYNYESINSVNMDGWYMADGMTYFYTKDNPQYDSSWWRTVDRYKMPGTTVDTQERDIVAIKQGNEYLSSKDFVGGAVLEGTRAAVAMDLESYHNEVGGATTNTGNGGAAPMHNSTLTAEKAWFMFDDEVVCLGSDINANDGFNVLTVIDNRRSTESELLKKAEISPYEIKSLEASIIEEAENLPEHTIDNKLYTRWSAQGDVWITYDLGETVDIGFVAMAFYSGDKRSADFEIEVSEDAAAWSVVYEGNSSGTTANTEIYKIMPVKARYVKIVGHGNNVSAWNSISEVSVYPPTASGELVIENDASIGTDKLFVDGADTALRDNGEHIYTNTGSIYLEHFGGYYFPKKENITVKRTGDSASFCQMWIDHGANPKGKQYEYIVLPGKTYEEFNEYVQTPDVTVLTNNGKIQAVYDKSTNTYAMVFREKGTFSGISVDKPLIVMMSELNGEIILSACDPTHKLESAAITLNGKTLSLSEADSEITLSGENKLCFNLNGSKGKTYSVKCKIN